MTTDIECFKNSKEAINYIKNNLPMNLRYNLFQFLKLKNLYGRKRSCVGCIGYINNKTKHFELEVQGYASLSTKRKNYKNRKILKECNESDVNIMYYFELLLQYFSKENIQSKLMNNLSNEEVVLLKDKNFYQIFCWFKEFKPQVIKSIAKFRFLTLEDIFTPYECEIFEWLKTEYPHFVNVKIVRNF